MKIPYKLPRAVCRLCGKEWTQRNVEPRLHHCTGLPTREPVEQVRSFASCGVSVHVTVEDLQRYMTPQQIAAVMHGLAQVIAAEKITRSYASAETGS